MALDQVCRIASINAVYVTLNMRGQDRKIQDLLRLLLQCLTLLIHRKTILLSAANYNRGGGTKGNTAQH